MNLSFLTALQELNLSSNNFGDSKQAPAIFKALSTIPSLKKLNLSRNKLIEFSSDLLPDQNGTLPVDAQVFQYLEELYFAFNLVMSEERMFWPVIQIPALRYLVITGNPFAMRREAGLLLEDGSTIATSDRC
jgi:Leucine-rich repeat (LRR) protein